MVTAMWQTTEVDGVPVVWADGPPPLSAALFFRVGVRDETLRTAGISHLVEHLTMSTLGRVRHDHNASVDLTFTQFVATGPDQAVLAYLRAVCAGLSALPLERLSVEAKVLRAEGGVSCHPAVAEHLRVRFGVRGAGMADVDPPALDQITKAEVQHFAARMFVRGNAVLALTGPPPDGLRLPLPPGGRAALPRDVPVKLPHPTWFAHGGPATSVSFFVDDSGPQGGEAVLSVLRIALDRATDRLRHERGWVYEIDFDLVTTSQGTLACLYADPPANHADEVRDGLLTVLRDLRDAGPTSEELADDLAAIRDHFADPRSAEDEVASWARGHLLGEAVAPSDERLRLRERLTADACRCAMAKLDKTLVVGMAPDTPPSDGALHPEPQYSTSSVNGRVFRRRPLTGLLRGVPRGASLIVSEEGVTLRTPAGDATATWDRMAGAARSPDGTMVTLIGADGITIPVAVEWFRHGSEALELILARLDPALVFQERPDEDDAAPARRR